MLCNRPNELGKGARTDANGVMPFKPQVHIDGPLGWNAPTRLLPKVQRKQRTNGVLLKHRLFLKDLEQKKFDERMAVRKIAEEEAAR